MKNIKTFEAHSRRKISVKEELSQLKDLEKKYFDTYKTKRTSSERAKHLEEMAAVIRKIEALGG